LCNDHDALASAHVLITLIPAYLLYVSQHIDSAHAWLIVTSLKVASRWYFVCVIDKNMRGSAFIPYKIWGKTAQNYSGLKYSSGLDYQGWTRRNLGFWWNLRHYTNDHYGSELRSYADRKQTPRCTFSAQHYHCSEVSRAENTRLVHGTRSPLNYVFGFNCLPPSVTI